MVKTSFLRDGRAPIPEKLLTSQIMSAIKGKNTSPEKKLKAALIQYKLRGLRSHLKTLPGIPDVCYPKEKLAIFVNGCFWHRCPKCRLKLPKSHKSFWRSKFIKNVIRDKQNIKMLKKMGWATITIWECEIKKDVSSVVRKVGRTLSNKRYKK